VHVGRAPPSRRTTQQAHQTGDLGFVFSGVERAMEFVEALEERGECALTPATFDLGAEGLFTWVDNASSPPSN